MKDYIIVPKPGFYEAIKANSEEDAIQEFALKMDMDMHIYFDVVDTEEFDRRNTNRIVIIGGTEGIDEVLSDNEDISVDVLWYNDYMDEDERESNDETLDEMHEDPKWHSVY